MCTRASPVIVVVSSISTVASTRVSQPAAAAVVTALIPAPNSRAIRSEIEVPRARARNEIRRVERSRLPTVTNSERADEENERSNNEKEFNKD